MRAGENTDVWSKLRLSGYFHIFSEFGAHITPELHRTLGHAVVSHIHRCDTHGHDSVGLSIIRLAFENLGSAITPEIVTAIEEEALSMYWSQPEESRPNSHTAEHRGGSSIQSLFEVALSDSLRNSDSAITPDLFRHAQREALAVARRMTTLNKLRP